MIKRIFDCFCTYPRSQYKRFIVGFLCWLQWSQCSLCNGDWKQDLANWLQSFYLFYQVGSVLHCSDWSWQDWALVFAEMFSLMPQKRGRQCTHPREGWETSSGSGSHTHLLSQALALPAPGRGHSCCWLHSRSRDGLDRPSLHGDPAAMEAGGHGKRWDQWGQGGFETGPGEAQAEHWAQRQLVPQSSVRAKVIPMSHTCLKPWQQSHEGQPGMETVRIPPLGDRFLTAFLLQAEPGWANLAAMANLAVFKIWVESTIRFCWAENVLFQKKTSLFKINLLQVFKSLAHSEHLKTEMTTTFQKWVSIESGVQQLNTFKGPKFNDAASRRTLLNCLIPPKHVIFLWQMDFSEMKLQISFFPWWFHDLLEDELSEIPLLGVCDRQELMEPRVPPSVLAVLRARLGSTAQPREVFSAHLMLQSQRDSLDA